MDVFVIPVAPDRYELYCEPSASAPDLEPDETGVVGRMRQRFATMLRQAEEQGEAPPQAASSGLTWTSRVQQFVLGWVAERIAEQRLLWNLRRQSTATVVYPRGHNDEWAVTLVRRTLRRDYDRHRVWLVVDSAVFVVTGALALLPGPNIVAYYFAFRVVGHFLSMRGATQGLRKEQWTGRECDALAELREAMALDDAEREQRVREIATRLRLPRLPRFLDRMTARHA